MLSASLRGVVILLCPGRRLSSAVWFSSSVISILGGHPSTTTPTAPPCDSPNVVIRNNCPNEFPAICAIITPLYLRAPHSHGNREIPAGTVKPPYMTAILIGCPL